jgi:hypothetical protein
MRQGQELRSICWDKSRYGKHAVHTWKRRSGIVTYRGLTGMLIKFTTLLVEYLVFLFCDAFLISKDR